MKALSAACLILAAIFSFGSAEAQSVEAFKKLCVNETDLQKRADACTAALESGTLSDGERSFALAMRGGAYIGQALLDKARKDLEEAQRLNPANPLVVKLADVLQAAEATQQAYSACREFASPSHGWKHAIGCLLAPATTSLRKPWRMTFVPTQRPR